LTFEQVERGFLAIASVVDNEQPKKDPPPKKEGGAVAGIIDAFNNRYSAKELLERNRYRWVGDGWAHPDSSLPQTAGVKPEGDRVRSYSASDPLNDGRHSHDAFSIYTILEHHGDERAAVRSAAELLGFNEASCPPTTPPRGGCADPVPQETTVAAPKPIEDITAYTTILPDHIANYEPPHHPGSQDEILQYLLSGDKGDAQLFAQCVGDTVAYDSSAGKWYVFANGHWQIDNYGWIRAILSDTLTSAYEPLWETLDNEDDKHERKTLSGKLTDLATTAGTNSVLKFAQPYLALKAEWDSNPYLLGVKNGVVDLRTGEHRPCTPQDYIRTVAPTEYDKEATAPRWLTFIDEIADSQEIAGYMQRVLGYATYGLTTEHIMLILYGPNGRNGKDTLLKALQRTLGSAIASTVSPDCIIEHRDRGGGPTPHLLDLRGKRMAVVNESRRTAHLNGAQVKQITGGGQISARGLYEGQVTFFPTHTVFLITNHKPSADSDDEALWERVHLIGFNKRFVNKPAAANELPADKYLDERLQQEAPGILTWLVQGAVAYWQHGLQTPDSVMIATRAMKNENDYIGMFVDDRCLIGDGYTVKASLLYERYKEWAGNNGYRPMTNKTFTQRLLNKYPIEKKKTKQHIEYHGIALTY
jgi:putative DNA primase/helicase